MNDKTPLLFPITVFEQLDTHGPITKARARIFYKYQNRNGGYITDEFADKLLATLPGSPVKGIYDEDKGDYTDHGSSRIEGKAYGFVPETNHNITYEQHLDEDDVMRTYACADVYLWTSLYDEAIDILRAAQSMELYEPSVKGEWKIINGQRLFEYTEGSFLGLQILGKEVEPCFEGAAFFSLLQDFPQDFLHSLYNSYLEFQSKGEEIMNINFKLSDAQKANKIFLALNEHEYRYYVHEVYDEYAIIFDFETESFSRVDYEKDDEAETVTLKGEITPVFVEYLTEEEKDTLAVLRNMQVTYEAATEDFEQLQIDFDELARKNEESEMAISTLSQEREVIEETLTETKVLVEELQAEVQALANYKVDVETAEKEAIIDKYEDQLDKTILDDFREKLDEFTSIQLAKELAFALVQNNPSVFTNDFQYLPKNKSPEGLAAVLDKYKKK